MRHTRRSHTLSIGTISSGTLRPEDLADAFLSALRPLRLSKVDRTTFRQADRDYDRIMAMDADDRTDEDDETLGAIVDDLQALADGYAPDYCYVGSLEGDGAEIGVWPDWQRLDEDTQGPGAPVYRTADTPPYAWDWRDHGYMRGIGPDHTLNVNDHGNATLYRRAGRTWREVWAVV